MGVDADARALAAALAAPIMLLGRELVVLACLPASGALLVLAGACAGADSGADSGIGLASGAVVGAEARALAAALAAPIILLGRVLVAPVSLPVLAGAGTQVGGSSNLTSLDGSMNWLSLEFGLARTDGPALGGGLKVVGLGAVLFQEDDDGPLDDVGALPELALPPVRCTGEAPEDGASSLALPLSFDASLSRLLLSAGLLQMESEPSALWKQKKDTHAVFCSVDFLSLVSDAARSASGVFFLRKSPVCVQ